MKNRVTKKTRGSLNKTITLSDKEIDNYKKKLLHLERNVSKEELINKIINQDIDNGVKYFPDKFVDLMFIDPPYNLTKKFNSVYFRSMDVIEYEKWFEGWFSKLYRLLKDNSSVYICGDWKSSGAILNVGLKYLTVRNRITWEREKGRGSKHNWKNCSEDIWFFTKGKNFTFNVDDVKLRRKVLAPYRDAAGTPKDWVYGPDVNFRDTFPSNIWNDLSVPFWSMPENTDHPTQKPEKLLAKIILASSNKGDVVFDPFLGSGTTAVVAKKLGRKYSGVEIDEYYCCLTQKRLEFADKKKDIQGYNNKIFWERNTLQNQKKKK